jgi:hypothetical protein
MIRCQPVTALFDIDREVTDGRTISDYKIWLQETVKNFPNTLIFHDGVCDDLEYEFRNLIRIDPNELWIFNHKDKISEIIANFDPVSKKDITYLNPLYSLVQFSKFELLKIAKESFSAESYLWIDAGISRFLQFVNNQNHIDVNSTEFLQNGTKFAFEIDLKNNLDLFNFKIKKSTPGTCKRVISGTSFWVERYSVVPIWDLIQKGVNDWITDECWDNEQVMLRQILPGIPNVEYIIQWNSLTGSVARDMLSRKIETKTFRNQIIRKLMLRADST